MEWKFQGRLLGRRKRILELISRVPDDFVRKVSRESFNEQGERLRASRLMGRYGGINGVGPAIASVILAFYDPRNYGVFDIHVEGADGKATRRPVHDRELDEVPDQTKRRSN